MYTYNNFITKELGILLGKKYTKLAKIVFIFIL